MWKMHFKTRVNLLSEEVQLSQKKALKKSSGVFIIIISVLFLSRTVCLLGAYAHLRT